MLYKVALCDGNKPIETEVNGANMMRVASGNLVVKPGSEKAKIIQGEIDKHPTALFFRSKAIKADEPNSNGDYFSLEELLGSYKSFEGVPFFTNHDNQNVENARGKVIHAEWDEKEKSVYAISFVDREAFPHICRSIEEEYITGVSMGSVNGGAKILMSDLSSKPIEDVKIGEKVISPYGNICNVNDKHCEVIDSPMFKFELSSFHKCPLFSPDHPVLAIRGDDILEQKRIGVKEAQQNKHLRQKGEIKEFVGQGGWRNYKFSPDFVHAQDIEVGDFLLVPSKFKLDASEEKDDSSLYYLMGAYLGDGYVHEYKSDNANSRLSYYIGLHEKSSLGEKIVSNLKTLSDSNVLIQEFPEKGGMCISIHDSKIADLMTSNYKKLAHHKKICKRNFSKSQIINLVSGYIDTDGCIVKTYNKKQDGSIRGNGIRGAQISSCNEGLLEDIQGLLILLDIPTHIRCSFRAVNENSVVNVPTIEYTLFIPYGHLGQFDSSLKIASQEILPPAIKAGRTFIVNHKNNKYLACAVKNTEVVDFQEPTYDLTVGEDESYIADGIAIHNCSVDYSICNICGNKAEKTDDYCSHIRNRKGRNFSGTAKDVKTGEIKKYKNEPVFEYNYGIKFIELSAVVDPACPSCRIDGILCNDDYLKKVANLQNNLFMIKTAAIQKQASQEDLTQLTEALKTLEDIAISLIQNRQQIEVDFASDLVKILSELQTFVDELTGAGYGQIPGVSEAPPEMMPEALPEGALVEGVPQGAPQGVPAAMPVSTAPAQVGTVSGAGGSAPTAPTMPTMPILSFDNNKLQKVASIIPNLNILRDKIAHKEEENMAKRRTPSVKKAQKDDATKLLSNSWQEKQAFLQYIKEVPSIQNNNIKLSIKKRDDSFIIVAEDKTSPSLNKVWTFDDLSEMEREQIKSAPDKAAMYFMDVFSANLDNIKEGESKMTDNIKEAGASSVNKEPDVTQEVQLEKARDLYHSQTGVEQDSITEEQLAKDTGIHKREGEQETITEDQLKSKRGAMPREDKEVEVTQEVQLEATKGASPRTSTEADEVTQGQLRDGGYRTHTEPETITEDQLNSIDTPWARAASRDSSLFKSASEHMSLVVDALAETVIETGCTSDEVAKVAATLVDSTNSRLELGNAILSEDESDETVNYSERLAFWSGKIKVASVGSQEITGSILSNLRKVACDATINPEVVITAVDVATEDSDGVDSITERVEEKLASTEEETAPVNVRSELKGALASKKATREDERKEILASLEETEKSEETEAEDGDSYHLIETSFDEMGVEKEASRDGNFKTAVANFTRGALASKNLKLASIINVTIDGETVAIAVQTEGGESIEIPIGEEVGPTLDETVPEIGGLGGEGLEEALPTETAAFAASGTKMQKEAQDMMGGGTGGVGGPAGGEAAPAPGAGAPVGGEPIQSLTEDTAELIDEVPTAGEQQMPYSICPECGSSDVDIEKGQDGGIGGACNACSAEYEALIKKNIEFTITRPTKSVGEEGAEVPEIAEVPALPVAAQTKIGKDSLIRIASNRDKHGHVCPACGMQSCTVSTEESGATQFVCNACSTEVTKELVVSQKNPEEAYLRVSWSVLPTDCEGCEEARAIFASKLKVDRMIKAAAKSPFPTANCKELVAKKYGGNTVATYGPCKGMLLADCVCSNLQKLGMTKVRHMEKIASASMQDDPMDECIEDQIKAIQAKKGETIEVATAKAKERCDCMKTEYASENEDNIFIQAFEDDIESGKEKVLTASDLPYVQAALFGVEVMDEGMEDVDMADVMPESPEVVEEEIVTIVISKEAADEVKDAIEEVVEEPTEALSPEEEVVVEVPEMGSATELEVAAETDKEGEKEMALSMQTHKLRRVGEEVVKVAGKPTLIETIEKDVEAGVPRAEATMGNESAENINVPLAKPKVPRSNATMGHEESVTITLPDVPVDSSFMGEEAKQLEGTPAINNEIKGTVIAEGEIKVTKEAKQLKEVETVEKDVEAGVPRADATMGNEGKDNIDVPLEKPKVPRADATMGNEGADNINPKVTGPDVPVDSAYMGDEKAVQSDMPAINSEILKQVQQKKDVQLERIANARKIEAIKVSSKLLASKRITEEAYDDVVDALASFEIDKISVKAESMYPARQVKTASTEEIGHSIPAIVMESKEIVTAGETTLQDKLTDAFTIGSSKFDKDLVRYDMK